MSAHTVLIADDDREIVSLIADTLEDEGYHALKAYSGDQVLELLKGSQASLLILDIMMPGTDGLEVCRKVRNSISIPIIILSARDREIDKIVGLEIGADDYITKPFSLNELVARVNAHMRREKRSRENKSRRMEFGGLEINAETYEVRQYGTKVDLTTREFQILEHMASNCNRVLTREQIYDAVWGESEYGDLNAVTVYVKSLRSKIDKGREYIKTIWGVGYKFTGEY